MHTVKKRNRIIRFLFFYAIQNKNTIILKLWLKTCAKNNNKTSIINRNNRIQLLIMPYMDGNFTILIADDIQANLMVLEDMLSHEKFNVLKAQNGDEAYKLALEHKPDLILLDIIMPVADGFEACEKIKSEEAIKDIPVIFLTGKDQTEDIVKGFESGAVDYITKPFRAAELLARVRTHIELKYNRDLIKEQNKKLKAAISKKKKAQRDLIENERKFSGLITGLNDAVFRITYPEGDFEYISPAAKKVFGFSKNNFYRESNFLAKIIHPDFQDYFQSHLETEWGVAPTLKYKIIDPDGNERWIIQANKGNFDKDGNLVAVEGIFRNITTKEELTMQKNELEKINKNLTSSIRYAQFIQQAVLPSKVYLKQFIPDNFIMFLPRDVVSGDFYWIKQVNNFVAVAAADCTGHGVPGAFMSMLGVALLNEIVRLDREPAAGELLDELRKRLKTSLHQENVRGKSSDGMDISLCIIDLETKQMQYAGANSPLFIIRKNQNQPNELLHIKPDRMPVGVYVREHPFTNHKIQLQTDDTLYLFSDGIIDQFGGERATKYKMRRFKSALLRFSNEPMDVQKRLLINEFEEWKGNLKQLDDILVIGVKIQDDYGDIDFF